MNLFVNESFIFSINFEKHLLKSNQINKKINPNNINSSSYLQRYSTGTFLVKTNIDNFTKIFLSCDFEENQQKQLQYNLFNQNHDIIDDTYNFYKDYKSSSSESSYKNWGLLRCLMQEPIADWGTENDWS